MRQIINGNELEESDGEDPITSLIVLDEDNALTFFTSPQKPYMALLEKIDKIVAGSNFDVETPKGRKSIKSLAYRVARAKSIIDDAGSAEKKRQGKVVAMIDEARRNIKSHLESLQENVRAPLDKWEADAKERIDKHTRNLAELNALAQLTNTETAEQILAKIASATQFSTGPEREEFEEEFKISKDNVLSILGASHAARVKYEEEQKELEELRAIKAKFEAEKAAAEKAEAEKVAAEREKVLKEEAEKARMEAQAKQDELRAAEAIAAKQAEELKALRAKETYNQNLKKEEEALAKNRKHRAAIHNLIVTDLIAIGCDEKLAKAIVSAAAKGDIKHLAVTY